MARLNPEHLAELHRLYGETAAVVDLCHERGDLPQSGIALRALIADLHAAQDLRGLRTAAREVRAMLTALEPRARAVLLAEASHRVGHRVTLGVVADRAKTGAVLARGRIRNEGEYFLVRAALDELEGAPGREEESAALVALLDSYGR
jgi:hypothetical protein